MVMFAILLGYLSFIAEVASNNQEMWAFLVGALLPPFVAIIQQPTWPNWFRATVTVVICIVAGVIAVYLTGDFDLDKELVGVILRILVAAQATYVAFWKNTKFVPALEHKTALKTVPPPPVPPGQ